MKLNVTAIIVQKKVIIRLFAPTNPMILPDSGPGLDTTNTENNTEMTPDMKKNNLERIDLVNDFLGMWLGSQNPHATQM